jgi:hypothetical protein
MRLPWKTHKTHIPISEGWSGRSHKKNKTHPSSPLNRSNTKGTTKKNSDTQKILLVVKGIGKVQIIVFWFKKMI